MDQDLLNRTSTFQNFPLLFVAGCQKHSDKSQDITSVRKKDFFCFWERKIFNYSVSTDLILKWICKFYQWSQIQWKKRLISLFQYTMHADMLSICAKQSIHSLVCLFFTYSFIEQILPSIYTVLGAMGDIKMNKMLLLILKLLEVRRGGGTCI